MKVKSNKKIITYSVNGTENGFLIPILNVHDHFVGQEQWPKQIYCTTVVPGEVKGPHLHKKRWGLFTCIKGDIKIVTRIDGHYEEYFSGENYNFSTIQIPAGIPNALINIGNEDAYVLNMPSPAWHIDDQDDWDVEFPDYDFGI